MTITDTEQVPETGGRRRRGGGAEGRRALRQANRVDHLPFIRRKVAVYEVLDEEGLAIIEGNADLILEEIGIEFREDEEALAMWREAGADVQGSRVRLPRGLCRSLIATAPRTYTQHARNPERNVEIGGNATVFAPVYGPPFVRDLDNGRRYGTIEDFRNFVKLAYMAPAIHHSGGTVCEPVDVPVNKRHLDMVYSHIRFSDKPFMGSVTHPERAADSVTMAALVFGADFVDRNCVMTSLINANSPMVFDGTMLGALKVYARANQATIVTPFILAGAMSPVTVAGTLTQVLAEVLAGAALTQLCRKGAPVVFGCFASSISMQSGAPTFGTPEPTLVSYGAAQLARRLGIPFRTGGSLCASKVADAQAAYESANTLNSTVLSGTNFVLHAAGWLEGGLSSGYEKFVMDCDQLAMQQRFCDGVDLSENGQALSAIREVGPGSHYLGCAHTQANFENAFYRSTIADNNSYEQWLAEGEKAADQRANALWKKWLAEYEAPPLDPGIDEALKDFIARKKASMPDAFA
jgi:trimethylamine--corrinoid protein Co-methyltransferase